MEDRPDITRLQVGSAMAGLIASLGGIGGVNVIHGGYSGQKSPAPLVAAGLYAHGTD